MGILFRGDPTTMLGLQFNPGDILAILGILVWVLTLLVDLPVVGEYFKDAESYLTEYADNTNYKDEFADMSQLLAEINENLKNETVGSQQVGDQ